MKRLKDIVAKLDGRDAAGLMGLAMLVYGGERIYPGLGFVVGGAAVLATAVLVR